MRALRCCSCSPQCLWHADQLDHSMLLVGYGTEEGGDYWCALLAHLPCSSSLPPSCLPPALGSVQAAHPLHFLCIELNCPPCLPTNRIIRNSWSTQWGEGGYFKVSRDVAKACGTASDAYYAVVADDVVQGVEHGVQ